jgi:hypothetical protein
MDTEKLSIYVIPARPPVQWTAGGLDRLLADLEKLSDMEDWK